jgi:hypothetical protein
MRASGSDNNFAHKKPACNSMKINKFIFWYLALVGLSQVYLRNRMR